MEELHQPVMIKEVLSVLDPQPGENYIDLTAGYAGHASKILDVTRNYKGSVLIDRDEFACKVLAEKYAERESVRIVNSDFYSAALQEVQCGNSFDLLLADFGVSSPQLDEDKRGFSFMKTGPLDMRMDQKQSLTAAEIVNKWSERELTEIFIKYGEEKPGQAKLIAREIVHNRPYNTTTELAEVIAKKARRGKIHPATRIFQAIRIVVNDELGEIERTLPLVPKLLKPGGRAGFITFHSLEDRLVKNYLTQATNYGVESELAIINKKPIVAEKGELVINPRSRSAKLRACRRV
ncbi:16S rRNA (cytosine(1402)-N(4))-methyltransferase RsmH [Candidatus Saccharibacteria bacterium]|nr:16S rRNA (cytosine(1402)-N(4))-methyltransferase RsmH [Candidatus Saccharibacteria bacterium]